MSREIRILATFDYLKENLGSILISSDHMSMTSMNHDGRVLFEYEVGSCLTTYYYASEEDYKKADEAGVAIKDDPYIENFKTEKAKDEAMADVDAQEVGYLLGGIAPDNSFLLTPEVEAWLNEMIEGK